MEADRAQPPARADHDALHIPDEGPSPEAASDMPEAVPADETGDMSRRDASDTSFKAPAAEAEDTDTGGEEAPARPSSALAARRRLPRVSRRIFLVTAGGGVLAAGAGALVLKETHLYSKVYWKLRGRFFPNDYPLPAAHPQPLPTGPMSTPRDVVIFDGKLAQGWQDWSWGEHKIPDSSVNHDGQPVMTMHVINWDGLQLVGDAHDATGLGYLQCWVQATQSNGQVVTLTLLTPDGRTGSVSLGDYTQGGGIANGAWRLARVPLGALGFDALAVQGMVLQAGAPQDQGSIALSDLRIVYSPDLRPPVVQRAWTYDLGVITLAFDQQMEVASAGVARAYLIGAADGTNDANYPPGVLVAAVGASYHIQGRTVSLAVPKPLRAGGTYTVTVAPVSDRVGVASSAGMRAQVQVTRQPLAVAVGGAPGRTISPEIYGNAGNSAAENADLGVTLARWGGNAVTRYNWKLGNAFSAARDYNFQNGNYGATSPLDRQPSGVVDQSIAASRAANIGTLLTIPTIGWVAKDDSSHSINVPAEGGPPLVPNGAAIAGYDPAANRARTCVPSRARKGAPLSDPPDLGDRTVAQDEWVYHLVRRFGRAAEGGVRYYAMDNEPDLWPYTHTDIRPAQLSYDQMLNTFLDYATAVKAVDPTAQTTGPVSWGWPNYFYSPLDKNTDNYRIHADRNAHGDMPFLAWWLDAIRRHDEATGRRSLDVLDLHFYPQGQGVYSDDATTATAALRLRSTRGLWDASYMDESWIGDRVRLIPRMLEWVNLNYPGTKIALTEWNWGAEGSVNGALALGEVLGVFGREGLDIACHWGALDAKSPAYAAFKLYGNYDGAGGSFLGTAYTATSTNSDLLSCYAARTPDSRAFLMMVLNKSVDSDLAPALRLDGVPAALGGATPSRARGWRVWPDSGAGIVALPDVELSATAPLTLSYVFPASSLTLLRLEAGA